LLKLPPLAPPPEPPEPPLPAPPPTDAVKAPKDELVPEPPTTKLYEVGARLEDEKSCTPPAPPPPPPEPESPPPLPPPAITKISAIKFEPVTDKVPFAVNFL
jgi:hypothetical protein